MGAAVFFGSAAAAFAEGGAASGDGMGGFISGSAVTALAGVAIAFFKAKFGQKSKVEPVPLPVETHKAEEYVRREEFERHVEAVEKRFAAGNEAFRGLRGEIAGMRREMQEGFTKINDRISPVAEACAANSAAIQILLKERKP